MAGSVPLLHPEAQTVDEMLAGWRNQQLCGELAHGTIAGRCWMCSPRSNGATTDQQRTRLPMWALELAVLAPAESDSAEFTSNPDGPNACTTLEIRQV